MKNLLTLLALAGTPLGIAAAFTPATAQDPDPADSPGFVGNWIGTLNAGGVELRLRFVITEGDDGLDATVFSIDQGNAEIPVETVTTSADSLSLFMPMFGASYAGKLSAEDGRITGTFTQGASFPLVLERAPEGEMIGVAPIVRERVAAVRRPQDPEEPYPYLAENVTFPNRDEGHTLAGTFTRPTTGGPFPAVVLISGSGPQDRDEALMGHRPFLVLADHLTRRGIAVLRYDDRGVGESTGDFASATTEDFATDALAGVAYLKSRDDVDPGAIGLAGHSEGGLVAPMAAVRSPDVGYIVLMAGTGVNGEEILYAQGALIARAAGVGEVAIAENRRRQSRIFEVLKSEPDAERAAEAIEAILREGTANASPMSAADAATMDQWIAGQIQQVNNPWFRFFLTFEPAEVIEKVTVPVLAINGEKDLQVPFEENLRAIEAALQRGGNNRYEIHALPDLNHLFQHAETGAPGEYQTIEETWSPEAMELIADWILKVTG